MTGPLPAGSVRLDGFALWAPTSHRDRPRCPHRKGARADGSLGRQVCHASECPGEPPLGAAVPMGFSKREMRWGSRCDDLPCCETAALGTKPVGGWIATKADGEETGRGGMERRGR